MGTPPQFRKAGRQGRIKMKILNLGGTERLTVLFSQVNLLIGRKG
jgi:hypothetical protein